MTPAQVEARARQRYNSVSDTNFFTQAEIFDLIYDAELELSMEALVIENKDATITTVDGTRTYAFPSLTIAIKRIEYDGQKLEKIDFRDDDRLTLSNSAVATKGTPQYYEMFNDVIFLRPVPDSAKTLTIYLYQEPVLLTTAATALSVPTRYHSYLVDFVVSMMAAKDDDLREAAVFYGNKWEANIEKAKKWERKRRRQDSFASVKDEESLGVTIVGVV